MRADRTINVNLGPINVKLSLILWTADEAGIFRQLQVTKLIVKSDSALKIRIRQQQVTSGQAR